MRKKNDGFAHIGQCSCTVGILPDHQRTTNNMPTALACSVVYPTFQLIEWLGKFPVAVLVFFAGAARASLVAAHLAPARRVVRIARARGGGGGA